ncbi:MAG: GH32 C-terminal domain-containing protein [Planctomycetota bacterium]
MSRKLDRRSFLAKSVALTGAAALGGCSFDKKVLSANQTKGAERELRIEKRYLNFPVRQGSRGRLISCIIDGKVVREFEVALVSDRPDFWVFLDVSDFKGKTATLRIDKESEGFGAIYQANTFPGQDQLYKERFRPQFHFSSRRGWINDPNGLVFYDGEYHLFYQHNPYGWDYSRNDVNKTWGHAVSKDLVHWTELADAIHPDRLGTIFSGSAVIDERNTTGFQTGKEKPLVCLYTSAGGRNPWSKGRPFTQSIAYSNDRGRTFTKYEHNPVQEKIEPLNRDPKIIWHEPTNQWVIVLHFDQRAMGFFTSKDLKSWQLESELESSILEDCPELFQLPVDGNERNKKWMLYGGSGHYLVGEFDGKEFKAETREIQFSYGNCFYASQTFNNIPEEDGRRIQMAWGVIPMPGMPFNQQLLFPVELTLRTTDEGLRMFAYPVKEIENIHTKEYAWTDVQLKPGQNIPANVKGGLFDIDAQFAIGEADEFGFVINGLTIAYNRDNNQLSCGEAEAKLKPADGKVRLRILADRTSLEIFANDGRVYMPVRMPIDGRGLSIVFSNSRKAFLPDVDAAAKPDERGLEIFTRGGNIKISSLKIHELKSIWN